MSRSTLRLLAVLALTLVAGLSPAGEVARKPADPQSVAAYHEARLRKLHLVRPDLINYPLMFDVIC